mmetsp:Transcript_812/g.1694  ORF Transcript_812/g.1694 Transcript_812/m.1694 type:complete len:123 (+) Transcript_812:212-580(+)
MKYNGAALGAFLVKQSKGLCNKCRKYGHKSVDCQDKQTDNNMKDTGDITEGKFHGKCHYCVMNGHKKGECPKRAAEMAANALDEQLDDQVRADEEDIKSYDELVFLTEDSEYGIINLMSDSD